MDAATITRHVLSPFPVGFMFSLLRQSYSVFGPQLADATAIAFAFVFVKSAQDLSVLCTRRRRPNPLRRGENFLCRFREIREIRGKNTQRFRSMSTMSELSRIRSNRMLSPSGETSKLRIENPGFRFERDRSLNVCRSSKKN